MDCNDFLCPGDGGSAGGYGSQATRINMSRSKNKELMRKLGALAEKVVNQRPPPAANNRRSRLRNASRVRAAHPSS